MKRQFFLMVAVVLMVLPGCASTSSGKYASRQKVVVDQQYVETIETSGRRKGVQITWINVATMRVASVPENRD